MEIEREKQKVISRNHWMFRLHRFAYGKEAEYQGYCPLFWMTTFTISSLPLIIIGRGLEGVGKFFVNLWPESSKPVENKQVRAVHPNDSHIVSRKETGYAVYSYDERYHDIDDKINLWFRENPQWESLYEAAKAREEIRLEALKIRQEKDRIRQEKLDKQKEKFVAVGKHLVKPVLFGSAVFAGWGIYKILGALISIWSWSFVWSVTKIILGSGIVVLIGFFIISLLTKLGTALDNRSTEKKKAREDEEPGIFTKTLMVICEAFEFIKNGIQIIYYKKCPLIVLTEDETRPIERIKSE